MNKRRWALLGFNLLLATAILVQPGAAASWACDFEVCICACLADWDDCDEGGGETCEADYAECEKGCKKIW
ncbi:hypothetical protein [Candidatus Palauibacter sp.]|uniref:hypothetical protein n=1 Tax=Candidatus Palauibacter sp. TaxID=3101350 RepID=UPI003AF285B8